MSVRSDCGENDGRRLAAVHAVAQVQAMPYDWPVPPDAEWARRNGRGSCASKHALLAEELEAVGIASVPLLVVGSLVPAALQSDPDFATGTALLEVHECLTVLTPWGGPVLVDVTWDPALMAHGLAATEKWDGLGDMELAVQGGGPGWAVPRDQLRVAKDALRRRIYSTTERSARDRVLAALARRFESWRLAERISVQ